MRIFVRLCARGLGAAALSLALVCAAAAQTPPRPLVNATTPVDWWFVFKFNVATGPSCTGGTTPACIFGGKPFGIKPTKYVSANGTVNWGQRYAVASSASPALAAPPPPPGNTCLGDSADDPVGATYGQIFNSTSYFYVVWNDQFDDSPMPDRDGPWGHAKGILAWDKNGDGVVMQVSTPSWPASGSQSFKRKNDGNTLGCVNDNDVEVSQHFFALKLNKSDLLMVLGALANASVATASKAKPIKQIVKNGGPPDVQAAVNKLGILAPSAKATIVTLSSGVRLISKPSNLLVPPWQMVSALLKAPSASAGPALKAATWWMTPAIDPTNAAAKPGCWDAALPTPGPVAIAQTGTWDSKPISLIGGTKPPGNHAKIGVAEGGPKLSIFGDMNQQGTLAPKLPKKTKNNPHPKATCDSSQNGRGGTFYVVDDPKLFDSMTSLLKGKTAPVPP
jgi:deoxyribonuclease II